MKREIIITNDGSNSIFIEEINESYHSKHGAIVEAEHVFIKNGLLVNNKRNKKILEVGFGTGLNALLTVQKCMQKNINVDYHAIELFPINKKEYNLLNFSELIGSKKSLFLKLHNSSWQEKIKITDKFQLTKYNIAIQNYNTKKKFDIIYFDAFSPNKQPDLWTYDIFKKMYSLINENGFLVTYCAQGKFRRILKEIGFNVISLDGPPGKRQMTRAHQK